MCFDRSVCWQLLGKRIDCRHSRIYGFTERAGKVLEAYNENPVIQMNNVERAVD
ncbi:MAG: hypothetical protein HXS44_00070 [Theionarchaea archaeon]|nr:hypothetical protein [Theionarchaea archaeon]